MRGVKFDYNEILCTYRVRKKMNLENTSFGGKTFEWVKSPLLCVKRYFSFFLYLENYSRYQKCFIQKFSNKTISIHINNIFLE